MSRRVRAAARRPRIVVLGMLTKMPVAGVVWQNLHYLLGFERLGCEAFYVETHGRTPSMLMSNGDQDGAALAAAYIQPFMQRFGFGERWAYRAPDGDGRCFGMSESALGRLFRDADAIVNLHGGTRPSAELAGSGRLVYVETDPVQLQLELAAGLAGTVEFLQAHCAFFTFAENWGRPDCGLPPGDERYPFVPTRQPVVLDLWPDRSPQAAETYTTVGNWRQDWRDVTWRGERYTWSKHHEFGRYLDMPARTGRPFELALSSCGPEEREMLVRHGWRVRDGLEVSGTIARYQDYIGSSRGEFTVAKEQNVRLRTGWFSDRSATYLASGRPVVTQDTGFGAALPTGDGLFAFDSPESASDALDQIDAGYARHARAARELAREHLSHDVVLGAMLNHLGIPFGHGRGPGRAAGGVFAPGMVLEPLSRRPTTLPRATVQAGRRRAPERWERPPALGARSASIVIVTHDALVFTRLCLAALLGNTDGDFEVIVVDNGSSDGTPAHLDQLVKADARVRVVLNGANRGFAAACNEGLALARGEHLVLLNNDTLVAPGWLSGLLEHLRNPDVGLVGPVTNRIGNEAEVETSYETWQGFLDAARLRAAEHAGAWSELGTAAMFCMAMRRDTYAELGPLDERYEIGLLEDDDYSERARAAGYQLRCIEDVLVHHFGEASFGRLVPSGEYARVLRANQQRFAEKWGHEWEPYPRRPSPRYELDAKRLRDAVNETVPTGATVLVISRGDDALLQLNGHRALHFPQGDAGGWAGHHPADSDTAIGQLEALREDGAEYLAVPQASGWWLDHYAGLREHLESCHDAIACDEPGIAIYRLAGGRA